jgi:hypothetical protein
MSCGSIRTLNLAWLLLVAIAHSRWLHIGFIVCHLQLWPVGPVLLWLATENPAAERISELRHDAAVVTVSDIALSVVDVIPIPLHHRLIVTHAVPARCAKFRQLPSPLVYRPQ